MLVNSCTAKSTPFTTKATTLLHSLAPVCTLLKPLLTTLQPSWPFLSKCTPFTCWELLLIAVLALGSAMQVSFSPGLETTTTTSITPYLTATMAQPTSPSTGCLAPSAKKKQTSR